MLVEVQFESADANLPTAEKIKKWVDMVLAEEDEDGDICIRLVGEEEGKMLNQQYRNGDQATNVLSFSADVDIPEQKMLGDLAICTSVVASEAQNQNKPIHDHYAHMVVHGVLHLLGHDHQNDNQAQQMESLEVKILDRLEVPNPYEANQ